jgi:RNA polymerase sigma-70 factor (ECF subfamily)
MMDDSALVSAVLTRAPGAFEQLVARHEKLVWHLVFRVVGQPEDTRELCQEVYLRVFQRLHQFRFESSLATWIGRVAYGVACRHLRRKQLPLVQAGDEDEDPVARIADDFDLEASHAKADELGHLTRAIEMLTPLQRTIITLYHLDELPIAQIAAITDMAEGTIKSHLFRARLKLRQQLQDPREVTHAS